MIETCNRELVWYCAQTGQIHLQETFGTKGEFRPKSYVVGKEPSDITLFIVYFHVEIFFYILFYLWQFRYHESNLLSCTILNRKKQLGLVLWGGDWKKTILEQKQ